jgi:predicted MFS family arabinose efflux permease
VSATNGVQRVPVLAPFAVRSFRFQWPADLATSWAFEMETLILGWYILSTTGSVQQLVLFGSLAWLGSLFSPFFGVLGDRIGFRALLCATRGAYAVLAAAITVLAFTGTLQSWHLFVIAAAAGLMRPSDIMLRNVIVSHTMRPDMLMQALGIARTTSDTARIAGALAGTGGMVLVGMGPAYVMVTALYLVAFTLSLGVGARRLASAHASATRALADLREAAAYVWHKPDQLGAFSVAFLVNLLAFPFGLGLMPYAAKEVFGVGQVGLGVLVAAFATGALAGSLFVGAGRLRLRAGRVMLWSSAVWFVALLLFGQTRSMGVALALLFVAGFAQSFCMTPLAAVMLRGASEHMRGRVMGMRMLAIWGLPLGLLAAGWFIARFGFAACTLLFACAGLAATAAIGWRWREALWRPSALANAHL